MKLDHGKTVVSDPHAPLAGLVDASADYIWILALDGGVACMNSAAERLFSHGRPGSWTDGWPEENRLTTERALATALGGQRARFRLQHPGADGAVQYLDITVSPMRDPHGEISRLFAVAVDVTSQIESRAFLTTVIDALPQALTVYDLRAKQIVLANRSAEELSATLHAGDKADGSNAFEWSTDNDAAVAGARRITRTDVVDTATGPRRFSTLKIATYDDSGARHLISLSQDVTDEHADHEATHQA
ncbi:MAG: PAS domain-containing protein, partial [Brevundimonas sp.]